MSSSVEWRDVKYKEIFEQELLGLQRRREADPSCTVKDIEGVLHHIYIMEGADSDGRGEVVDISMSATIAAFEHFIASWKAEIVSGG